jgi:hypothetical protein
MREYYLMGTTPIQRLNRMRESFDANKSVLIDDYAYFTKTAKPHASIHQSKAARKSAESNGQQSQEQSGTRSSDKNGD